MIINPKLKKISLELTDELYRIYYNQLVNNEIDKDEYYSQILKDTIEYFSKIEEYEKCSILTKL